VKSRYNRVMERIIVTPGMSKRIIHNISFIDCTRDTARKKSLPLAKMLSLAACFLVIVGGAALLRNIITPPVQVVPDTVEYSSLAELSANIDFSIIVPSGQLQGLQPVAYARISKVIAEIRYSDGDNIVKYRMARGRKDISDDNTVYTTVKEYQVDNRLITLKGDETGFYLAAWTDEEFSFSLGSGRPWPAKDLLQVVLSVKP
jgi:hypothetical protein